MKKFLEFIVLSIISLNLAIGINAKIIQANENITSVQPIDRLQKIKEKGVLTVLSADTAPYSYKDPRSGEFSGIDADIMREIARRLGIRTVDAKYIGFPYAIEETAKNPDIDLLAQGIYMTDERKKLVNFSNPIYTEVDTVLTRKDTNINNKNDLKNRIIGATAGTLYEEVAKNWKSQGLIRDYTRFYDNNSLLLALENKTIDAGIISSITAENALFQKPNSNFKLLSPNQYKPELNLSVGYAFKKEDITLLNAINEKIQEMRNDGTLYEILAKRSLISHYIP